MTFLQRVLGVNLSPNDERAWTPTGAIGAPTASGQYVSPQTALKISTFWACVDLIASSVGMLPLALFQRKGDNGREKASKEPLYEVLHDTPNEKQTPFEFKQMMTAFAIMRKAAYARIVPGMRGAVDQLIPLHPDRVKEETIEGGAVRYKYTPPNGPQETINGEDMFVLRRFMLDGASSLDLVEYARESLGLSMAARQASARLFGNDSRPVGILTTEGKLGKEGRANTKESWEAAQSGRNYGRVAVLEQGLTWQSIGIDPKTAQFFEREEFQALDICRWLRVPPTMVGLTGGATMWGSGVEQLGIGFVTYTLMPVLVSWQQAVARDLIIDTKRLFAEFIVAALLRGDTATRFAAYATAAGGPAPWMTRNEIRAAENQNPVEGLDDILQPANMGTVGEEAPDFPSVNQAPPQPPPAEDDAEEEPEPEEANVFIQDAAARVVRKEIAAMSKAARKFAGSDFGVEVHNFYSDHVAHVAEVMHIADGYAVAYCAQNESELLNAGPDCMADWDTRRVGELVRLAKEA